MSVCLALIDTTTGKSGNPNHKRSILTNDIHNRIEDKQVKCTELKQI